MSVETVFAYDLSGMVKSATMHEKLGGAIVTYTMSNDRWKRLPPDIQQVLMTAGLHATQTGCHAAEAYAAPAFEKLLAQKVAFYDPPAADRAEIDKRLSEVSLKWSKDLDARGKPGTAVLNAYREALAQTKGN
jgi:TRAP-type C4-dicarboxylate transport system substrate-binding protein